MARSRPAFLLAIGCMLLGCTLPKGQLSDAVKTDADGGVRDSGVHLSNQANKSPPPAGTGELGGTGAGGKAGASVVRTADASVPAQASPPAKPKPKANGQACDSSAECASTNCEQSPQGDKRCYGALTRGRDCNGPYECDGYVCVPRKHGEAAGVCIDTSACAQDACQQNQALAFCQLDQKCSAAPLDFAKCYEAKCAGDTDADAGCAQESVEQHLNEIGCCPSGGVSTGSSCNTSPQCGCADDQKCDSLREGGRTVCGPIGSVPAGGACLKDLDCPKEFTCRGHLCKRYCAGPNDDSCPKGACVAGAANGKPEPGIFFCTRSCDPIAQADGDAGCGSDQGCEPNEDGNSDCYATTGTGMQGDSCDDGTGTGETSGFKCAPGFGCMIQGGVCEKFCRVQDGACSFGTCHSFGPSKRYAGSVEIGYCQ